MHAPGQAERREREREEEEVFRAATLQRLAEEDRLEQLSAQRRREKTLAHRREVERLLQHRRALFAAAQVCLQLCRSVLGAVTASGNGQG